jgi:hypothetical protein
MMVEWDKFFIVRLIKINKWTEFDNKIFLKKHKSNLLCLKTP